MARAPSAGLIHGSDGYFYGTTEYGVMGNYGTVYRLNANGTLTTSGFISP
jgi:uncharacterized repeat protein (TIGR03803 family)